MDVYLYKAALWCGSCIVKTLVAERKAAPGAIDIVPAEALEQIVSANGFTRESDHDSAELPKGPHADGGGEAHTPQHCDGCGQFLGNPLTDDVLIYVEDALRRGLTNQAQRRDQRRGRRLRKILQRRTRLRSDRPRSTRSVTARA
jgi:hypothetical protein